MLDTGGLLYELILAIGRPYMITANIDVSDGLANGAIGHLEYIEYFRHFRLWLRFPDNCKIGRKIIRLSARYIQRNDIVRNLVLIARKNATIYFDKNRISSVKRNHLPLIPATAMTIHKSQGGTFDQIVYSYDKKHDQYLIYIALSRVKSIEGLFIVSSDNNCFFIMEGGRQDHCFHLKMNLLDLQGIRYEPIKIQF